MKTKVFLIAILCSVISALVVAQENFQTFVNRQFTIPYFFQGSSFRLAGYQNGLLGNYYLPPCFQYSCPCGMGYPESDSSGCDTWAAPWIGAVVRLRDSTVRTVAPVFNSWSDNVNRQTYINDNFFSYHELGDSIWRTSILIQNEPNRRGFDDDGDGRIDEDELDGLDNDGDWIAIRDDLNHNGRPDHGEPNVDEDYGAVSEEDVYIAYQDSNPHVRHFPLGIKIFQKSYAWKDRVKEPILPIEYYFINQGPYDLDSVYLGFLFFAATNTHHPSTLDNHWLDGYLRDIQACYSKQLVVPDAPYIGAALLGSSPSPNPLLLTVVPAPGSDTDVYAGFPLSDRDKYPYMSRGLVFPAETVDVGEPLFSIGPYRNMKAGDTLKLTMALTVGRSLNVGPDNFRDNVAKALELYNRGFTLPNVPPSPPLKVIPGNNRVTLDWTWHPGDRTANPIETWDDSNRFVSALPDTHWRKRNPPPGKTKGGRIFEGFNVWRSEYPAFEERQFTALKQFDVADDLGFNGQTGLQFTYTDSMVTRGRRYWYAVTSLSIPEYFVTTTYDTIGGRTFVDTIITQPVESLIHENAVSYQVPFTPSYKPGQVKVVPNPYRTDMNYTYEGRGWEGLARHWDETKRLIWFIHLPPRCTIRIFSLGGDLVSTIGHDDDARAANGLPIAQEEWHLMSDSHRAIASGVYVFLVESEYGNQIGKFVVIR